MCIRDRVKIITTNKYYNMTHKQIVKYCFRLLNKSRNIVVKNIISPYIYCKMIMIDPKLSSKKCYMGSSLWWSEGFNLSREIGMITTDSVCIDKIYKQFEEDYKVGKRIYDGFTDILKK